MKKPYIRQIILLCILAAVSIGIMVNCAGLFYTPVSESLGVLQGSFSMTVTIALLICAAFSFLAPVLLYTFPAKQIILAAIILSAGSTALMAFASSLPVFYILSIFKGIGMGLFSNTILTSIISNWFYEKSSLITSIVMSFSGVAGAVFSPIFGSCISAFGWRSTYLILAAVSLILTLPALLMPFRAFPLDMSLYPYGYKEEIQEEKKDVPARFSYTSALFIILCIICMLCSVITGIGQYISGFGIHCGLEIKTASTLLSFTMAGNIIGKLLIGILAGRIGPVKASFVMSCVNILSLALLLIAPAIDWMPLYLVSAFLYGSIYSLAAVASSLLTRHYYGPVLYVKAYAVIGCLVSVGSALALPLIGYIYDFTASYQVIFIAGIIMNGIFIAGLLLSSHMASSQKEERLALHEASL